MTIESIESPDTYAEFDAEAIEILKRKKAEDEKTSIAAQEALKTMYANVALGLPPILEPHPPHYEIMAIEVYANGRPKFV